MQPGAAIAAEFGWPPAAPARALPRVETAVAIERPPATVFAYATTPALWHTWHPATASVHEVPDRPLLAGETMLERIAAAGRRFDAVWTVLACDPPQLWVIATATPQGDARIVYRVASDGAGSRFHRTLDYRSRHWPWSALDGNVTRWLLARQSRRALANLKAVVERGA